MGFKHFSQNRDDFVKISEVEIKEGILICDLYIHNTRFPI